MELNAYSPYWSGDRWMSAINYTQVYLSDASTINLSWWNDADDGNFASERWNKSLALLYKWNPATEEWELYDQIWKGDSGDEDGGSFDESGDNYRSFDINDDGYYLLLLEAWANRDIRTGSSYLRVDRIWVE